MKELKQSKILHNNRGKEWHVIAEWVIPPGSFMGYQESQYFPNTQEGKMKATALYHELKRWKAKNVRMKLVEEAWT